MIAQQNQNIAQLFNLTGKAAIVTGAAMGIGQGIALRLAEAGAAVMLTDLNLEAAQTTVNQINSTGGKAQAIVEIVRKETKQTPVHRGRLIPFQTRLSIPALNQQPLFARQVGRKVHGFPGLLSCAVAVAQHGP